MPHSENVNEEDAFGVAHGFDNVKFGESPTTHRYPIYIDHLNGNNNVPIVQECIHFTAVKQGGISLQKEADNSKVLAQEDRDKFRQDNTDKNGLTEFDKTGNGSSGSYSYDAEQKAAIIANNNTENEKRTIQEKIEKLGSNTKTFIKNQLHLIREPPKNLEHCFLYMPNSVQFSEGASWGAEALGGLGNFIKQGIRGEGGIDDMLKNFGGGIASKLGKGLAVGGAAALGGVLGAIGVGSLLDGVGSGLRAAGRFTENPYEEQLFNGIEFRTFTFEFAFAPSSEAEGNEVEKIIKMFRFHSRPNFVGGVLGEGLYTFPNEFNIEFLMNAIGDANGSFIKNKSIPSIYNCVCTNVSTNYSPEGFWVALSDGRPVSYNLNLAFTETKKITQDDVKAGY
jgi:hypothetical protein